MTPTDLRPCRNDLRRKLISRFAFALVLVALTAALGPGCDSDSTIKPASPKPLPPGTPGRWQDLGLSTGFVEVEALTAWNGLLIAGGTFYDVQGHPYTSLAEWDGATWIRMGPNIGGAVYALAEYNGHLIVGGSFAHVNGDTLRNVAEWDGTKWTPLGSGTNRSINALAVYGADLYAGGTFDVADGQPASFIARWDGTSWHPVGSGFDSPVWTLAVHQGKLIAGGSFIKTGTNTMGGIAAWNGSIWSDLNGGVNGGASGFYGVVYALTVNGPSLVAGGGFTSAGGVPTNHVATWNGSVWDSLGSGIGDYDWEAVKALSMYADTLVVGGTFPGNVRRWDGSQWLPMSSLNGHVAAFAMYNDYLIAGGFFPIEGGQWANGIARWGK